MRFLHLIQYLIIHPYVGILVEDEELLVYEKFSQLAHKIRSYQRCWCDQEASASVMRGLLLPCYVIEVLVGGQQEMVFAAEDGGIYVRRFLSLPLLTRFKF